MRPVHLAEHPASATDLASLSASSIIMAAMLPGVVGKLAAVFCALASIWTACMCATPDMYSGSASALSRNR